MIAADIWQRPVGQGGLCEGTVSAGGPPIRWVYDCGSNQTDRLASELQNLGGDLDFLFLSHLDKDHVNGLDELLMIRQVDEVVLPYLDDYARLLVLAAAVGTDRITGQLLDFMAGPAGWLRSRGVRRVTFVRAPRDGQAEDGPRPFLPRDAGPKVEGRLRPLWTPERTDRSGGSAIGSVEAGSLLTLSDTPGHQADWVFIPFAHTPSKKRLAAFRVEVRARFPSLRPTQIVQQIWTSEGRAKLRACYDEIWSSDHNLVSLSLYTGPASRSDEWMETLICGSHPYGNSYRRTGGTTGWLTTGDANLSGTLRRKSFLNFYEDVVDSVSVLVAPHHGAASSWHSAILHNMRNLRVGCAAAGPNGYGHPHPAVVTDIQSHPGTGFWQVSEAKTSLLHLHAERLG